MNRNDVTSNRALDAKSSGSWKRPANAGQLGASKVAAAGLARPATPRRADLDEVRANVTRLGKGRCSPG